ncbi:hypothetical protein PRIPAC_81996 [Pristionchus pacificus]|uniref:Uncharacterized protein n=1 Tax=Pristionchus pacificus TaxID=54126 RepID=A0A2A6CPA2_PRIPA|nr:hypothetical protein PRIPAC_81996 [Pristionchus pacificus]|eukprot:PDM79883.1 hypothetical protein PRIPAC_32462 [Pristionchus pacificus]
MREAVYDVVCAFLLGLGNMFLFMGYDTQLAIVEPVLRSVHDRAPDTISAHAGFYGAGMCTVFFMLASLVSPCVLGILGSKYTLVLGSLLFTIHLASFQYIHYLSYYITSAAIGPSEISTIAGNSTDLGDLLINGTAPVAKARSYRQYSDEEIKIVYGAFVGVCLLGNLIFVLIPTKNVKNSIAARFGKGRVGFRDQMQKIYDTFTDVRALELIPLFCFLGLSTCFWVGAYPTTLIFSQSLSGHIYLPALYLVTFGVGEILMGILISIAANRIKNFAQLSSLIVGAVLFMVAMVLALLSTPPAATNSPTADATPLLEPSPIIALVIALLLGMSDNSFNTSRTVICALVIPEHIAQVYSMSKFYQSLAESVIFFVAPMMSMTVHFSLISFFCIISIIFYWQAAKKTRRAEKEPALIIHEAAMREAVYDLLCTFLLGFGNMCLFMGERYETHLAIVEPVLRSVHDRAPDTLAAHAGFFGAGICTVFFMLASLVSPCVLSALGSKYTLLLGSLLFTLHLATFQYIHYLSYYITSATIGIGYAIFYSGHGGYLTEHSTKKTIERNSTLTFALATSCMIAGGCVLALTAHMPETTALASTQSNLFTSHSVNKTTAPTGKMRSHRQLSMEEIRMAYGAIAAVCLIGNIIFLLIPPKNVVNSIAARSKQKRVTFVDEMKKIWTTFTDARALQLVPLFSFLGLTTCFWVGAYPTTLIFSRKLSGHIYLPAMYLIVFGCGEILMGVLIALASKHVKFFAQIPSLIIGAVLFMAAMLLALLSTPSAATNSPTNDDTPLLEPSPAITLIIALLLGMSDNSFNTSVLCALVIPENIAQSLAESVIFFVAPMMSMTMHFCLASLFCLFAIAFYWRAATTLRENETEDDCSRALTYRNSLRFFVA